MSTEREFKRGLFGLRRDDVDRHFARLALAHQTEVASLRAEVRLEQDRQEALKQQIEWLETHGIVPSVLSQLQASRSQAEDAGSLLAELLRWDIVDVETLAAQEHEAIAQEIAHVQAELDEAIADYEQRLADLAALADAAAAGLPSGADEVAATGAFAAVDAVEAPPPVDAFAAAPGLADAFAPVDGAEPEVGEAVDVAAEAAEAGVGDGAGYDAAGDDGAGYDAAGCDAASYDRAGDDLGADAAAESAAPWADTGAGAAAPWTDEDGREAHTDTPDDDAYGSSIRIVPSEADEYADPAPFDASAQAADAPPAAAAIESGLMSYLAGKRIGQDLYTQSGELIAPAGSPLSIELIERAEREGVLSDLVIDLDWQEAETP